MSIIMGTLGGLGSAAQDIGGTLMKSQLEQDRDVTRSNLELARQQTLAQFQEQLKNAPLNRISARAKDLTGQDVPQEPAAVTSLTGFVPSDQGPTQPGFQGDVERVKRAINAMPEGADKDAAIEQFRKQVGSDKDFQASIVNGVTRKRTADEAVDAAVGEAKTSDLPAYAAYESSVGKPLRDERRVDIAETREDNRAKMAAALEQGRNDRAERAQQGMDDRMANRLDTMEKIAQERIDSAEKRAEGHDPQVFHVMNSYDNDIKSNQAEIRAANVMLSGMGSKDPRRQALQDNITNLTNDIKATKAQKWAFAKQSGIAIPDALTKDAPAAAASTPAGLPSGAKQIGTSGGKAVYQLPDGSQVVEQ